MKKESMTYINTIASDDPNALKHSSTTNAPNKTFFQKFFDGSSLWEKEGIKLVNSSSLLTYLDNKTTKKTMKKLLLQGIPPKYRAKFWLNASGATREKINNKDYYYNLTTNYPEYIPGKFDSIIEADLPRTFPNEAYFKKTENITKLRNVLKAYSRRNGTVGYCQGFNFIVGKLLMILDNEEDAFWTFTQVIERILPVEYYSELAGMMGDCALTLNLLKTEEEEIMTHLNKVGNELFLNNLLYQWYVSLFVQSATHDVFLAVWDAMFVDGNIVIFRAAIGILTLMKEEILALDTMEDLSVFFESKIVEFNDVEKLMKILLESKDTFDMEIITKGREQFLPKVIETIKKTKSTQQQQEISNVECDLDWPFCVKELNKMNVQHVLVIKRLTPMRIEENFYTDKIKEKIQAYKERQKKRNESKNKNQYHELMTDKEKFITKVDIYSHLLIERKEHTCGSKKATSQEIRKSKENGGSIDSFDSIDKNSKNDFLASSLYVSSYFETDLKAKEISTIINKIDKSESTFISLNKPRKKPSQKEDI